MPQSLSGSQIDVGSAMDVGHETLVIHSALWAAAGDALGWITELTTVDGLFARADRDKVVEPIKWRRIIGGRGGIKADLPAGTYSDDTQLRLAVCRAIRGDGVFDPEAFAKIELPVWAAYALGGGRGTKAAAANLARRDTNWFSNFFELQGANYLECGGNGAAMRIQPHVWCANPSKRRAYLPDVVRDAIVSHGHPHGFCGAALHAMVLGATIGRKSVPSMDDIFRCVDNLLEIETALAEDQFLESFWRPTWEQTTGTDLVAAVKDVRDEAFVCLESVADLVETEDLSRYGTILDRLDCRRREVRGSGLKTTIAAIALLHLSKSSSIENALCVCANELESDTDTIATMFGAMRGYLEKNPPAWTVQDRSYISNEARRLAAIASGQREDSFAYPGLARWEPPASQSDAVGLIDNAYFVRGLGPLSFHGEAYSAGDAIWQWGNLSFGQSVLIKRRKKPKTLPSNQMPETQRRSVIDISTRKTSVKAAHQAQLTLGNEERTWKSNRRAGRTKRQEKSLAETLYDQIASNKFDALVIGQAMEKCLHSKSPFENAVKLAALLAEASIDSN